ncbi:MULTISPECIES: TonB-dependent receptor domain-containing protein [unclassified Novosphingobium]|uniref:TonB-dependent receptor domain-containing protein n=1 Tax=unclassified Novosphingobium TaxID=2644732 RepID=UPI00086D500B|nr:MULTISPECIES: TonB-dependent receptor [unclassified Novosphingobium]MBN9143354.1 TonB-dependent receptor [Novosphingobium sp.]MDR6706602.1 outer membrane receptor protein involved in Fe transport [Novosphingobium sp. 1748]ODU83843.1 MAG: hypothetical protein ABT10_06340 [Novosphingobium sp. SCN 63-17]OJX92573.1 MAG: hypothetical protein BGP00_21580 [Novosphingobium sp. 63-713]
MTRDTTLRGARRLALSTSLLALALAAAPAMAADEAPKADDDAPSIIVTGSRVSRQGFVSPTPVTVVGGEQVEHQAAVRITDVLNTLPALRQTTSPSTVSQQQGGNYVQLRGLGSVRTLVLVDNQRFVATTVNNLVDVNLIPTSLIERIEVVTGGASAAWGSDAVAGVSNFILKKNLQGLTGTAQYGQSTHGDSREYAFSLAGGRDFANGKGHVQLAGELSKSYDYLYGTSRGWASQGWGYVVGPTANPAAGAGRYLRSGTTSPILAPGGTVISGAGGLLPVGNPLRGIQFGANGTILPFAYGTDALGNPIQNNANLQVGGQGVNPGITQAMNSPLQRGTLYGTLDYDLGSDVHFSAQASYGRTKSSTNALDVFSPNAGLGINILTTNPYVPAALLAITPAGTTSYNIGRFNSELGRTTLTADNQTWRIVGGFNGKFGTSWKWNVAAGYGRTDNHSQIVNHLISANWKAAQDAVLGPNNTIICRINSTNPADVAMTSNPSYAGFGAGAGCVPVNVFGTNSISSAAAAYVMGTQTFDFHTGQTFADASLSGEPFSTWAGPVAMSSGIEIRRESLVGNSDPISNQSTATFPSGGFNYGNPKPINGHYDVKEGFVEAAVPLLQSHGTDAIALNGAVRLTDYSTSGTVTTWKLGGTVKPIEGVMFRVTRSRDIRAPNINELFLSTQTFVEGVTDYGNGNASVQAVRLVQGNAALKPERADTFTAGVTLQPAVIPGLRIALDYYDIKVGGVIGSLTAQQILNFCYGQGGFNKDTSYCNYVNRNADGSLKNIIATNFNLQRLKTRGLDVEVAYNRALGSGRIGFRFLGNALNAMIIDQGTGLASAVVDRAGEVSQNGFNGVPNGSPKWRHTFNVNYSRGPFDLFGQWRYVGPGVYDVTAQTITPGVANYIENNSIASISYFDLAVSYKIISTAGKKVELFLRGDNILDKSPPIVVQGGINPIANSGSFYDLVGARVTGGVRFSY